jgi:hypothetical protein
MCREESERTAYWKLGIHRHQLVSLVCLAFTTIFRGLRKDSILGWLSYTLTMINMMLSSYFVYLYADVMGREIEWLGSDQLEVMLYLFVLVCTVIISLVLIIENTFRKIVRGLCPHTCQLSRFRRDFPDFDHPSRFPDRDFQNPQFSRFSKSISRFTTIYHELPT